MRLSGWAEAPGCVFAPQVRTLVMTLAGHFARRLPPCGWNHWQDGVPGGRSSC